MFQGLSGGKTEQLADVGVGVGVGVGEGGAGVRVGVGGRGGVALGVGVFVVSGVAVALGAGAGVRVGVGVGERFQRGRASASRVEPICRSWPTLNARTSAASLRVDFMCSHPSKFDTGARSEFRGESRSEIGVLHENAPICGTDVTKNRRFPVAGSTIALDPRL